MRSLSIVLGSAACLLLASCGTTRETRVKDTTRSFTTVVVDAGHGGKDNGAFRRYGGAEPDRSAELVAHARCAAYRHLGALRRGAARG